MGSLRVGHDWATSLWLFTFMHWRRKWQPTPVFLPRESQGRGSLVGCHLWGHKSRTRLKQLSSSSSGLTGGSWASCTVRQIIFNTEPSGKPLQVSTGAPNSLLFTLHNIFPPIISNLWIISYSLFSYSSLFRTFIYHLFLSNLYKITSIVLASLTEPWLIDSLTLAYILFEYININFGG